MEKSHATLKGEARISGDVSQRAEPKLAQDLVDVNDQDILDSPFRLKQPLRLPKGVSLRAAAFTLYSLLTPTVTAQDLVAANCSLDQGEQKPGRPFDFPNWVNRGHCVRAGSYAQCRVNLMQVLNDQDPIHSTEYGSSAGILALLPTIGALFGTPTSEIWTLLTIVPFGGALAMLLSFGGTMMPTSLVDYQNSLAKQSIWIKKPKEINVDDLDVDEEDIGQQREKEKNTRKYKIDKIKRKITTRIAQRKAVGVPRATITSGLLAMLLLFCGVMVGLGIVEYGAVYSNGCTYNWWFHVWYLCVTVSTMLENWAQLPFRHHWKFYLTSIPYDVEVSGGQVITNDTDTGSIAPTSDETVALAIKQLKTVKPASIRVAGSKLPTNPRSSVIVLVSIARKDDDRSQWRSFFQLVTKAASITVFVFGTCVLSAVTLLAMPMAQMVLMVVLAAGVGSRVIAGGIVDVVAKTEPMIHVITDTEEDAFKVITEIFTLQQEPHNKFQLELEGHIFVGGQRVARRSAWTRRILGVMANPYSLVKAEKHSLGGNDAEEAPLQRKYMPSSSAHSEVYESEEILPALPTHNKSYNAASEPNKGSLQVELRNLAPFTERQPVQRKAEGQGSSGKYQGLQHSDAENTQRPYTGT